MRRTVLAALVLLLSQVAQAYDTLIRVGGNITEATCTIESSSRALSVPMGQVWQRNLQRVGAVTGRTEFSLRLTQCSQQIVGTTITFHGDPDTDDNTLLRLKPGGASGLAIELLDKQGRRLAPNQASQPLPLAANGNVLQFFAQYRATRSNVTPGKADAVSSFTLEYQ